jgi:hypothetical protein
VLHAVDVVFPPQEASPGRRPCRKRAWRSHKAEETGRGKRTIVSGSKPSLGALPDRTSTDQQIDGDLCPSPSRFQGFASRTWQRASRVATT